MNPFLLYNFSPQYLQNTASLSWLSEPQSIQVRSEDFCFRLEASTVMIPVGTAIRPYPRIMTKAASA